MRIRPEPTQVKHLRCRLEACPANIRLNWKSLQGANSPAYFAHFVSYEEYSVVIIAPGNRSESPNNFISKVAWLKLHLNRQSDAGEKYPRERVSQ